MYLNYFKLQKAPFNITPDPDLLFLSSSHKEALGAIIYGVRQRKGFISIIGEVGLGKTTILRSCLERIDKEKTKIIYIFNPNVSFTRLVKMIHKNIAEAPKSDDLFELVNRLHILLIDEYKAGRNVVLIIDEAQNMPVETLESLRMLSNLETATEKLIQIVFSGQPEFEEKLNTYSLRQLKQRIALKVHLKPFTWQESFGYIAHRVSKTSAGRIELFSSSALNRIIDKACGVPRIINILCDNCLITAFGRQQKQVSTGIVREVLADYEAGCTRNVIHYWRNAFAAACIVVFSAGGYLAYSKTLTPLPAAPPAPYVVNAAAETGVSSERAGTNETARQQNNPRPDIDSPNPVTAVTKIVKKGDTFAGLIKNAYGYTDNRLFKKVLEQNPGIADVNVIREGEKIVFPYRDRNQSTKSEEK